MEFRHQASDLPQYQSLPLSGKISIAKNRIRQWYEHWDGQVYVAFSGGKDSTVLLHLVREMYDDVPAVYCDTGLEYPEIRQFALSHNNVIPVRPKMRFDEVIRKFGYPLFGKEIAKTINESRKIVSEDDKRYKYQRERMLGVAMHNGELSAFNMDKYLPILQNLPVLISEKCCLQMKEKSMREYAKQTKRVPYIGTLAEESRRRRRMVWIMNGCNAYDGKEPHSNPLSVWTEQDIFQYILKYDVPIASVYGDIVYKDSDGMEYDAKTGIQCGKLSCSGCKRTGCIFCGFWAHIEKESRFVRLKHTHPKQYEYCIGGGEWIDNPYYDPDAPEYTGEWKNWNPKQIWVPSKKGLGMGKVFDMVNEIMGDDFIRYK